MKIGHEWLTQPERIELDFPADVYEALCETAVEENKTVKQSLEDEIIRRVRGNLVNG